MSECLHPITIRVDHRKDSPCVCMEHHSVSLRFRRVRPYVNDLVQVPCGKCINCLRNRQNALVSRCYEESQKRGSFIFMTLTYDESHLPLAQSLWRISKDTGEYEYIEGSTELVCTARDQLFLDRAKVGSLIASELPRYYEWNIDGFEDDEFVYVARLTPSVCRKDVRLWLKRSRIKYEREHGFKLSDFSYVCVSEYGPNTCRPHYHLAFFGLNLLEADWLAKQWTYGYTNTKYVHRLNPDNTDAWQIASRYIGKYMTKGKFECQSVRDKSAEKPRICQSMHIGDSLVEKVRSNMCAFDMYGEYDLDTLFCPSLGRCLNDNEIKQLCDVIPRRLVYSVDGRYDLPIPRVFREKVFYHQRKERIACHSFECGGIFEDISVKDGYREKIVRFPTAIWSLVADSIRTKFSEKRERQFRQYCSKYLEGESSLACRDFAEYAEICTKVSEDNAEAHYIDFLHSSKF